MRRASGYRYQRAQPYIKGFVPKTWQVLVSVLLLALVALSIGLGVGFKKSSATDTSSSDSSTTALNTSQPNTNITDQNWWQPEAGSTWQIELIYTLNDTSADVQVYDIDLFTNIAETFSSLHALGRKVICYFSAGSYEDFRPDSSKFQKADYGKALDGWPGEWWLNTSSPNVRSIMLGRLDLAVTKGCDGVDPDNIDGYENDSGLDLGTNTAIDYMTFLASEAHSRNLAIGLKNGGSIAPAVIDLMDWEVNEQCEKYNECDLFQPFIAAGKPVFHIEYPESAPDVSADTKASICDNSSANGFSTVLKNMNLDNWLEAC